MIFDLEMINSLSRPGFLHRTRCNGFFFELLTFHLDEFQSGGLAASSVEAAETQPKSSLRSLPICRKPLCLFPLGAVCVCVNLFSGEGITPASLAQLCCPSGMVSSFDADFYFCISWFVFQRESNMCHILTKALKGIFNVLLVHYKFLFQVGILNITCISLSAVFISRIDKIRHLASLYLKLSTFDNKLLPNFTCPGKSFHHKLIYLPQNPVP